MPESDQNNSPAVYIVGATGAVGREILDVLHKRRFPCRQIRLLASARSAGYTLEFGGRSLQVEELTEASFDGAARGDFAIFSAGATISKKFAPIAAERGVVVIDNSSAFRMDDNVPLVVPEINDD